KATDGAGRVTGPLAVAGVFGPAITVDPAKVTFNFVPGTLTIIGATGAVTGGTPPLTASVVAFTDPATKYATNVAIDSGGAFSSTMTDPHAQPVALIAKDSSGQPTSLVNVGTP